jgi:hypothetical protein
MEFIKGKEKASQKAVEPHLTWWARWDGSSCAGKRKGESGSLKTFLNHQ